MVPCDRATREGGSWVWSCSQHLSGPPAIPPAVRHVASGVCLDAGPGLGGVVLGRPCTLETASQAIIFQRTRSRHFQGLETKVEVGPSRVTRGGSLPDVEWSDAQGSGHDDGGGGSGGHSGRDAGEWGAARDGLGRLVMRETGACLVVEGEKIVLARGGPCAEPQGAWLLSRTRLKSVQSGR